MDSQPKFLKQWLLIIGVLVILAVTVLLGFPDLSHVFAVQIWRPKFEKQLGFKGITGQHQAFRNGPVFYITEVTKGGAFDTAGIKPGFVPSGLTYSSEIGFYSRLEGFRGETTTLLFVEHFTDGQSVEHTIEINIPK